MAEEIRTETQKEDAAVFNDMKQKTLNIIASINKVEGFYPETLMEKYPDKNDSTKTFDYLTVQRRVSWFRAAIKNGAIISNLEQFTPQCVCFKTLIYYDRNDEKSIMSTGYALELFGEGLDKDIFAKAETASIGRALALAGFGTSNCGSELHENGYVDMPILEGDSNAEVKPSVDESKASEFENEVQKKRSELNNKQALGVMITYGQLKGKMLKDMCPQKADSKEKREEKINNLRPYAKLTDYPDICHARTVAACRIIVEGYDEKYAEIKAS